MPQQQIRRPQNDDWTRKTMQVLQFIFWGGAILMIVFAFPNYLPFISPTRNPMEWVGYALAWIALGLTMNEAETITREHNDWIRMTMRALPLIFWGIAVLIIITAFPGHPSFIPPAENPIEKIGYALAWIAAGFVARGMVEATIRRSEAQARRETQPQDTPH